MDQHERRSMNIVINGVTEAQAIAIEDMLATWQALGSMGASRWTAFFADGDGNFRPKVSINGQPAKGTELVPKDKKWRRPSQLNGDDEMYWMDFDAIAWKLRRD